MVRGWGEGRFVCRFFEPFLKRSVYGEGGESLVLEASVCVCALGFTV